MDRERWQAAERIFERALEEDAVTRDAFLTEACDGDPALRSEVEELLRHHESAEASGFLEEPARLTEALDGPAAPEDPFVGKELGPYRVQSLHYFGGLNYDEIAEALEISAATVHRDLRLARAWLHRELSGAEAG